MPSKQSKSSKFSLKGLSRKTRLEITIGTAVALAIIAYIIWDVVAGGPLTQLFTNREKLISIVSSLGPLGPVVYMLLQALQGIVAPIPSNIVGIIGGFLFGWWGVLWTTVGATLGAAVVFWLSRRYGRKLVEKLVKKESLEKFDFVIGKRASLLLFLIFIIPGLPDDIVCYIAGLTDIPLKKLIVIFALGRLPAVVSNNYIGMGFSGEGNPIVVVIITIVSVLIFAFLYFRQNELIKFLNRTKDSAKRKTAIAKKPKKL
ncbi:TVP38/TMEM64 family protein [Candidatus Saccharibacteria bacterium]|nr:TVP38/TMEM64 family protein [Candidatus Saccharibacteria bacterium]